jgi:WD40 repeat protein
MTNPLNSDGLSFSAAATMALRPVKEIELVAAPKLDGHKSAEPTNQPSKLPKIAGYEIIRQLGRGGMGVVYLARETALNRHVAIKVVAAGAFTDFDVAERFRREAEAVARLQHPNIVQIFCVGASNGGDGGSPPTPFIALEYVDCSTLAAHNNKTMNPRRAAQIIATLARAIQYAHERGIIHRDLKPGNVLMQRNPKSTPGGDPMASLIPKVTDFGLAKLLDHCEGGPHAPTVAGTLFGTPEYMSPEQAGEGPVVGPASDIYALGVMLYELLTGRVPFQGADALDTLLQVRLHEPVTPSRLRSQLPHDLDTICLCCLQKEPGKRYASADALADDLEAWLEHRPIAARPIRATERAWKWAKRRPAIASLMTATMFVTLMGILGVFSQWQRAEARAVAELHALDRAENSLAASEDHLYFGRIHVAQSELIAGNQWDAVRVLDECRPRSGQKDRRGWEWFYLRNMAHAAKLSWQASQQWIWDLVYSPDGRWLATVAGSPFPIKDDSPGEATLWDAKTGELVQRLVGHTRAARHVVFSPDGRRLLTFGYDHAARIWELPSGRPVGDPLPAANDGHHYWHAFGNAGPGWFTPDSQAIYFRGPDKWQRFTIATGQLEAVPQIDNVLSVSSDATIALVRQSDELFDIVDMSTLEPIRRMDIQKGVDRAVISPDHKWVATSNSNLVEIYDVATGRRQQIFNGPLEWVEALIVSPDGQRVAAAGNDRTIFVWETHQRSSPVTLTGHMAEVRALAFSPDGLQLASCDQLGRVMVWDSLRNPRQQAINCFLHSSVVSSVAFTEDAEQVMIVRYDGIFHRHDMAGKRLCEQRVEGLSNQVRFPRIDVQFNSDGTYLFGPCKNDLTTVGRWSTESCQPTQYYRGHHLPISGIAVSGDGRRIATSAGATRNDGSTAKETFVWDVATGQKMADVTSEMIVGLALSSDGGRLAGVNLGGDVIVWDVATSREIWRQHGHGDDAQIADKDVRVFAVAFSRDDRHIATGGFNDGVVRLWNAATGEAHPAPMIARPSLTGIAFTPDGQRVAVAGYDSEVRMWDVATGHLAIVLQPPSGPRRGDIAHTARPVFSLRNNRLALVDSHGFIGCWDGRETE